MSQYFPYDPTGINNNLNWDLVSRATYQATASSTGALVPIPEKTFLVDSPVLMIGTRSGNAKLHWFVGCWAHQRLLTTPSSTSQFLAIVEVERKVCGLDRLTLIQFPRLYEFPQYVLALTIPRWHYDLLIEIWKYSGDYKEPVSAP